MKKRKLILSIILIIFSLAQSCKKNDYQPKEVNLKSITSRANSVIPATFNWETVDWMPTPPGQSQIPPPWIGQGSLTSTYGLDVVSDHKAADGWVLVYNTFDQNAPGALVNPYFILYNKYRGLMRIYLYVTTPFIAPSTYLEDGISITPGHTSNMLSFLGTDVVNYDANPINFSQIEPAPQDGTQPLAAYKWYMMQYEIAYDQNMPSLSSSDMQFSWNEGFQNVSTISLGGTQTGTIKTATGTPSTAMGSGLSSTKTVLSGAVSFLGSQSATLGITNATTGANNMGMTNGAASSISKGIAAVQAAATGNYVGAVFDILSAVAGGSSASSSPTVNCTLSTTISLTGSQTNSGIFPSSPTSMYIPGTTILANAQGFVPLYTSPMGVFWLNASPRLNLSYAQIDYNLDGVSTFTMTPDELNGSNIVFNPAVTNDATIQNIKEQIVFIDPDNSTWNFSSCDGTLETVGTRTVYSGSTLNIHTSGYSYYDSENYFTETVYGPEVFNGMGIRITFDVVPKNGTTPRSTIVKTFGINQAHLNL